MQAKYLKTAYFAYFQSIMRYGLVMWGASSRILEVLTLQKKAIRVISGSPLKEHCKPLFCTFQIQTIINLYLYDLMVYVFQNYAQLEHVNEKHNYNTRSKDLAHIGFHRLNKSLNSHVVISLKVYNHLIPLIKIYDKKTFLKKFYTWLLQNPFYSLDEFFLLKSINF